jgi:hypothetical protein
LTGFGQLRAGAALDQQRNEIPDWALLEMRSCAHHDRGNLIWCELGKPAGQTSLNLGDQELFANFGHRDSLRPPGPTVNP